MSTQALTPCFTDLSSGAPVRAAKADALDSVFVGHTIAICDQIVTGSHDVGSEILLER